MTEKSKIWDEWRKNYSTMSYIDQIKFALGFKSYQEFVNMDNWEDINERIFTYIKHHADKFIQFGDKEVIEENQSHI